jgi:hypothetical protein
MPGIFSGIHITNFLVLVALLVLWMVLFRCTHILVMLLRHERMIAWAIGPLGLSIMFLHEPSTASILLGVLCPALVSGAVLYLGLFTSISPISMPQHHPVVDVVVMACGVLIASTGDALNAFRDLRHPLWGEARILRSIQSLRATCARIHFTPFGHTYLLDHFGFHPSELLQAF